MFDENVFTVGSVMKNPEIVARFEKTHSKRSNVNKKSTSRLT